MRSAIRGWEWKLKCQGHWQCMLAGKAWLALKQVTDANPWRMQALATYASTLSLCLAPTLIDVLSAHT